MSCKENLLGCSIALMKARTSSWKREERKANQTRIRLFVGAKRKHLFELHNSESGH